MTSGIYMIRNTLTDMVYVGASLNIERRWKMHRSYLNAKAHRNQLLQCEWTRDGATAFEFTVIEEIDDPERIAERESHHIERLREAGIYNKLMTGGFQVHKRPPRTSPPTSLIHGTITPTDRRMLDELLAWWYPDDGRVLSMTLRRCIRETYEREKAQREK